MIKAIATRKLKKSAHRFFISFLISFLLFLLNIYTFTDHFWLYYAFQFYKSSKVCVCACVRLKQAAQHLVRSAVIDPPEKSRPTVTSSPFSSTVTIQEKTVAGRSHTWVEVHTQIHRHVIKHTHGPPREFCCLYCLGQEVDVSTKTLLHTLLNPVQSEYFFKDHLHNKCLHYVHDE